MRRVLAPLVAGLILHLSSSAPAAGSEPGGRRGFPELDRTGIYALAKRLGSLDPFRASQRQAREKGDSASRPDCAVSPPSQQGSAPSPEVAAAEMAACEEILTNKDAYMQYLAVGLALSDMVCELSLRDDISNTEARRSHLNRIMMETLGPARAVSRASRASRPLRRTTPETPWLQRTSVDRTALLSRRRVRVASVHDPVWRPSLRILIGQAQAKLVQSLSTEAGEPRHFLQAKSKVLEHAGLCSDEGVSHLIAEVLDEAAQERRDKGWIVDTTRGGVALQSRIADARIQAAEEEALVGKPPR